MGSFTIHFTFGLSFLHFSTNCGRIREHQYMVITLGTEQIDEKRKHINEGYFKAQSRQCIDCESYKQKHRVIKTTTIAISTSNIAA